MTNTMIEIASTTAKIDAIADAKRKIGLVLRHLDADLITDALIIALHRANFAPGQEKHPATIGAAYAVLAAIDNAAEQQAAVAALAQMIHERTAPRLIDPYCAPPRYPVLSAEEAAAQAARRGIAYAGDLED
jgi:hypothetical protein